MIDERDMYYGGSMPMNGMGMSSSVPNMGMSNPSGQISMMPNNYSTGQFNDINERINRLETPYANNIKYNNEPDNKMYMM